MAVVPVGPGIFYFSRCEKSNDGSARTVEVPRKEEWRRKSLALSSCHVEVEEREGLGRARR